VSTLLVMRVPFVDSWQRWHVETIPVTSQHE
jgi:hypothetical protein